jgi:hypothetical protein
MHCQTGAAEANDPRRANSHMDLSPKSPKTVSFYFVTTILVVSGGCLPPGAECTK